MKYRKGMTVRCLKDYAGQFTEGELYQVREDGHQVRVVVDDRGSTTNGWDGSHFEIVMNTDDEFEAMRKCSEALSGLDSLATQRVINYLEDRFV